MTIFCKNKRNSRKASLWKIDELALHSKKLVLNQAKLGQNSAKKRLTRATKPEISASRRLTVWQKTIRVLLDSGSSGDLLFLKKGSSKNISIVRRAVPQSWGTSNGTFKTDKVGDIKISFVEYSASKKI